MMVPKGLESVGSVFQALGRGLIEVSETMQSGTVRRAPGDRRLMLGGRNDLLPK